MTETYWCPGPWPWEWFRTCTREVPDPTDPCNASACMDARTKATRARRDFNDICRATRLLKYVTDVLRAVTSTPIWVIAMLFVISALGMAIGGPVGYTVALIATAGIAVYFLAWLLLFVLLPVAKGYARLLQQATADLIAAIEEVIRNCPANCRGDVSAPSCDLG